MVSRRRCAAVFRLQKTDRVNSYSQGNPVLGKLLLQGRLYLSGRLFFPGELCLSGRPYFSGGLALLGKLFLCMLFFVWIAAAAFPGMSCMAAEEDSTIDFVLVLDNSGTMAKSDPEGLTVSAAKMFIDMLPHKNARVAVVEFGSDYGADAYDAEKYSSYVSVPFPLSDISTVGQKIACKKVIAQTTQDGEYTPVGYAFQAACDVLEKGGAKPEDAGILLISDFRVTGQKHEDFLDGGYSYKSLEDAEQTARKNKWPVYTLEMNIDGRNDNPTDYRERIAARLRSGIPEAVGAGDYLPLHNASQAQTLFADIFKQFFDPNNRDDASAQSQTTDDNGDAAFPFSVGEMVAELNVTLTCENSAAIRSIEIGYGGQMAAYDLTAYQEPIQEEDRVITKEDRYVTVKLMLPPPSDDWKVIVHGDARTQLGMYALSIHDMDFTLGVSSAGAPEASDSLTAAPMDTVHLAASFIYDGQRYQAEKVYTEYGAVLEIVGTGQQIPMTAGNSEYFIDLAFDVPGTYTLKAIVNGDTFRTGSIESGICTVTIEGSAAQNVETEPAIEPETETEAVVNSPVTVVGGDLNYTVVLDQDSVPGLLKRFANLPGDGDADGNVKVQWEEHFVDPDGSLPEVEVAVNDPEGVLSLTEDENGMTVHANHPGTATITVAAADAEDPSVQVVMNVNVTAQRAMDQAMRKIRIPVILLVIVLVIVAIIVIRKIRNR